MAKSGKSAKRTTGARKAKRQETGALRQASPPRGTGVQKISASLDSDLVTEARKVLREGESLSGMLNQALEQSLIARRGLAAVEDYEREHGALTDEELAEADRRLAAL